MMRIRTLIREVTTVKGFWELAVWEEVFSIFSLNIKNIATLIHSLIHISFYSNADNADLRREDLIKGVIGTGVHWKIVLNAKLLKDSEYR